MRNENSCIQPHAENIWKTLKEVAKHNTKATIQNSANFLGPHVKVTTIGATEYISRAQGASKPPPATQEPSTTSRTTNQQQAVIATQILRPDYQMLVKLQCSVPCISSYNMKATMCQQCCKSGSSKIYKFIVRRLYVLLRKAAQGYLQHVTANQKKCYKLFEPIETILFPQARHHCL